MTNILQYNDSYTLMVLSIFFNKLDLRLNIKHIVLGTIIYIFQV